MENKKEISISDLPFDVSRLGVFHTAREECPGVYYVAVKRTRRPMSTEFYIVTDRAAMISREARSYGQAYPGQPDILMFDLQADRGGLHVLLYEIYRYRLEHHIPLPEGDSLAGIVAYGRELYPEYFGPHLVPGMTPWGPTLRYKTMDNGIFWIETESQGSVLAIVFPIYAELSDAAKALAAVNEADSKPGQKDKVGCLFFPWQSACVPVFELLPPRPEWKNTIDKAALMNAIWRYPPFLAIGACLKTP